MVRSVRTTCPYCGVGCGLVATVEAGTVISITGDPEHPANRGRLCSKGAALTETLGPAGRLLYPEINGRRCDWDAALDHVAAGFRSVIAEHGPDAVAFYVSGQLLTEAYYVANKLMKGYIGSANIDTNSRLCMASTVAGYKRAFGSDTVPCSYEDLELAQTVVLVGSNTAWCHPVVYQRIMQARENNPAHRLVVIDPRRTATCEAADLHLPLAPGSDAVLFNGLLAYLADHGLQDNAFVAGSTEGAEEAVAAARASAGSIDEVARQCGLETSAVLAFYQAFAGSERVVTLFSQGINQSSSGTDKVNSIINCHLLTGRVGRPGAGPFSLTGQPNAMGGREVGGLANQLAAHMNLEDAADRERVQRFWRSPVIAERSGLKAIELFQAVAAGRVRAVWIMGTNPVDSMPDADGVRAALKSCPLVVVSDCVRETDTTAYADVLLPATTWGERDGTVTNSDRTISRQRPFLPAPGEARPDWWIIAQAARRMGYADGFGYQSPAEVFMEYAALSGFENAGARSFNISALADLNGGGYDALSPCQWPVTPAAPEGTKRMFVDGRFSTSNGRARLLPIVPRSPANAVRPGHPLVLNTGRVRDHWHTMTRTGRSPRLSGHRVEPYAELHSDDAAACSLRDGELVQVSSRLGSVIVRARVDSGQRRGSVFVPMHWTDQFASRARVDVLVEPALDPLSGQPESKATPVRIEAYRPAWHGFLLSRRPLRLAREGYWAQSIGAGFWRCELAGEFVPENWSEYGRALLCGGVLEGAQPPEAGWIEYSDPGAGRYRLACLLNGTLESCLFVGPDPQLPESDYLAELFTRAGLSERERSGLLAGRPLDRQQSDGPPVCACFGVARQRIIREIRDRGLTDVEEIGAYLQAGTNCGSCLPELKAILAGELEAG